MVSGKGKEKVTYDGGKGKRKWSGDDKTGRKRKNPGGIQFFDEEAYQVDEDEDFSSLDGSDSGFESEEYEDMSDYAYKGGKEPRKASEDPHIKEEQMSEDEFDRMMAERYRNGSGLVTYAEDSHDHKSSVDRDIYVPSANDATLWKVKCMVGRERHSAFCLMQKHADLVYLRNKLPIISACALDHVKGFIIIEAEKQQDIYEACKGLSTIYSSKVTAVPINEISRLISIRSKSSAITEDMWVRVKNGRYKGDLGQVVKVNDARKKVTVKLIPRIDLKSMAEKFGGGVPAKRTAVPAQRLITHSELEEFRPLIQFRRDRDTNLMFEVLDGMMLKDGYLYKKISIDSLSFWGVVPTADELLKFEPANKDESTDEQWLTQLFGEKKKKEVKHMKSGKGGGKSEGSSSADPENSFELHDLVFIGRKDFGVVIGSDKDDTVKVIKEGSEGPTVVNVKPSELKIASFDRKLFTVSDHRSATLRANDEVRVLDGPLKGRQGIIKKIYRGILFLYDELVQENNGYICIKAQLCEKINISGDDPTEQVGEPVASGFPDMMSSPKSPLSPDKTLEERDNNKSKFARDDNGMFSVGQSLRIRIGPLKGYICRVLAVRRSDVTVKLDSKHKIITVKSEHLSEVRERNPAIAKGEDSGSVKPFGFLGGQDGSNAWMDGAALSTEDNKWNAGGSTERSSWSAAPSSDVSLAKESGSGDPDDPKKEDSWLVKKTPNQSSWGAAAASTGWGKSVEPEAVGGSSNGDSSWGKAAEKWNSGSDTSASKAAWGQSGASSGKQIGDQPETSAWKKDSAGSSLVAESESGAWGSTGGTSNVDAVGWGVSAANKQDSQTKDWATGKGGDDVTENNQTNNWNKPNSVGADSISSWGKSEGTTSWSKQEGQTKDWATGKGGDDVTENNQTNNWNKPSSVGAGSTSSWGKSEGTATWSKQDGGSSWGKKDDAGQEGSWGRSNTFDSGRGSGGRSGRGGGRGGRDNYGRGRSFDQDQSSSWSKEGQFGRSNDAGKTPGWSSSQSGGWGNSVSNEGSKGDDGWDKNASGKAEVSAWNQGSNDNKDGGLKGWGGTNPEGDNSKSSGWNVSKDSNSSDASAWGKSASNANEQAGAGGSGLGSWDNLQKPNENNKSSWNAGAASSDCNKSSGWGKESSWGSQKASEEKGDWNQSGKDGSSSSWNAAKKNDDSSTGWKKNENSSTGWGQGNWSKSGTSETGGNQESTWKGNWNSGGGFNDRNDQDDGGRGGGWRGRGGRGGDRGGFRGRGRSDGGDFGGRGRFGGRGGSDREGGYGGRGGDGFRGRGGFRGGRGRGDWNNREDNSNQERSSSWGRNSNDGEGWKSTGNASSWKQSGDNGGSSSWNQPKDNASSQGWGSSWNQSKGDSASGSVNAQVQGDSGGSGWGKPSGNKETSWNQPKDNASSQGWGSSWNQSKGDNAQVQGDAGGSGWGKPSANKETSSSWNNNPNSNDGAKAATSSWGAPPVSSNNSGGWNKSDKTDEGPSDSSGKAAIGGWGGSGSGKGGW